MQRYIELYWGNSKLGTLTYESGFYHFTKDEQGYTYAEQVDGCPTDLLLGIENTSPKLHPIFYDFEVSIKRKDLVTLLQISTNDDHFSKLYKRGMAHAKFSKESFWIKAVKGEEIYR